MTGSAQGCKGAVIVVGASSTIVDPEGVFSVSYEK